MNGSCLYNSQAGGWLGVRCAVCTTCHAGQRRDMGERCTTLSSEALNQFYVRGIRDQLLALFLSLSLTGGRRMPYKNDDYRLPPHQRTKQTSASVDYLFQLACCRRCSATCDSCLVLALPYVLKPGRRSGQSRPIDSLPPQASQAPPPKVSSAAGPKFLQRAASRFITHGARAIASRDLTAADLTIGFI